MMLSCLGLFCLLGGPAAAESRIALVIGNAEYGGDAWLPNTDNDARLMTRTLRELGFKVHNVINATRAQMSAAIRNFGDQLRHVGPDTIGLFYYSGHGIQVGGHNFLIPIDADSSSTENAVDSAISPDEVLRAMEAAGNVVNLMFINACRTNPFEEGHSDGIAFPEGPTGSFIGYATAPNELAWAGGGTYTPYAEALAREIARPGQSIPEAHIAVRNAVTRATAEEQVPWETSSLTEDVVLAPKTIDEQASKARRDQLWLYHWTNYFPPALLERFTKETGITVSTDAYDTNEQLQSALQADTSTYDVVAPSDYMVEMLAREGLLLPFDAPTLPNWSKVNAHFRNPTYDPARRYTIPYVWGTTGFAYDSAQVTGQKLTESWKEFFEPREELEGKIASLDDPVELYNAGAYYLGIDKCTESPEDSAKILALLKRQEPKMAIYSSEATVERMARGEAALHLQWNGSALRAILERKSVRYVYPKEGVGFWQDALAIPRNAPHPENAKKFLNWLLQPEIAAEVSNYVGYMNSIDGSAKFLAPYLKDEPAINMPERYFSRLRPTRMCSDAAFILRNNVWVDLKE